MSEAMKKKQTPQSRAEECIRAYRNTGDDTDVLGSYTGIYRDSGSMGAPLYTPYDYTMVADDTAPVQDADDL